MAPKAAPAPPLDFDSAVDVLGRSDPAQIATALTLLSSVGPNSYPTEHDAQLNIINKLAHVASGSDGSTALTAANLLLRLSKPQEVFGPLFEQPEAQKAFWHVFQSFHSVYDSYKEAYAHMLADVEAGAAAKADPKAKAPAKGAAAPTDPEASLPGPSKHVLDLLQRHLITCIHASSAYLDHLVGLDVQPWLALLKHHSPRLQVQALRLLRQLLLNTQLRSALLGAGLVEEVVGLLRGSPYGGIRVEAMATLGHALDEPGPALELAQQLQLPDLLLQHVLEPSTGVAIPAPAPLEPVPKGTAAETATPQPSNVTEASTTASELAQAQAQPAQPLDFSKPTVCSPPALQLAAAELLLQLLRVSRPVVTGLIHAGAVQLLLDLLPSAMLPDLPPPIPVDVPKRPSDAAGTIFASLSNRKTSTPSVQPPPKPQQELLQEAWVPFLTRATYAPPTTPAPSAEAQAATLMLLAALLVEPGLRAALWATHGTARTHLRLLHLFSPERPAAAAPVVEEVELPPVAVSSPKGKGSVRPGAKGKEPPPPAPPPPPPPTSHLDPPFPPAVQAAALECVRQLARDAPWARLLAFTQRLQHVLREPGSWQPVLLGPLAGLLQGLAALRLPHPGSAIPGWKEPEVLPTAVSLSAHAGAGSRRMSATTEASSTATVTPDQAAGAAEALPSWMVCNQASNGLSQKDNGLAAETFPQQELVTVLKALAKQASSVHDPGLTLAVTRALLCLPAEVLVAPPWPPLPSPPKTPPPPPLPTTQYLWDALGRPLMTDGIALEHV